MSHPENIYFVVTCSLLFANIERLQMNLLARLVITIVPIKSLMRPFDQDPNERLHIGIRYEL